ncbi:MAG: pyridoxal phosphate-dependent aminotransferase [Candidatus Latescibacteria bacterium]|nr:pyridoxal phosphate-dependent aminotransferase [Candidatus Latescibacterota bacterium]
MFLSPNVTKIEPSITLEIDARAKAMKAKGIDVISLSVGEPDFNTPRHICDAAIQAINDGFTHYTPATGIPELKKAVCDKFRRDNGLEYKPTQISINCGAKHSVFLAIYCLTCPGEEVIIPAPYWVSYPEMAKIAGGTPVIIEGSPETDLKVTADQVKNAITPKTKLIILNSPSNPTGMAYTEEELRALAEVIVDAGIYVISDEIYEKLVYDNVKHVSIGSFDKEIFNRTITINGVSKAYAMTGWRIGYTAGPEEIIKAMGTLQSQETSNPNSIAQKASIAALNGPEDSIAAMKEEYVKRREYIVNRLNAIDNVKCIKPEGAFYAFPDVSALYGKKYKGKVINGSFAFCEYMLESKNIAIVPGIGFGADNFVRISYATSMKNIETAMDRFESGVQALE